MDCFVEDDLLNEINASTVESIRRMLAAYSTDDMPITPSRDEAIQVMVEAATIDLYNDVSSQICAAMYNKARGLGSFLSYVVYDAAIGFALNELMAIYSVDLLAPEHYSNLHKPWSFQVSVSRDFSPLSTL
jgi:hypothetical protein